MRDELTRLGINELRSVEQVDAFLNHATGTALLFVNSVCGCAAGNARPALARAMRNEVLPDRLASVFAGQDRAATAQARAKLAGFLPSSPSLYLLKDGEVVLHIPRSAIEGRNAEMVAEDLIRAFNCFCGEEAPA
jgi:putative YphP/YqiW family bacilliredoxin